MPRAVDTSLQNVLDGYKALRRQRREDVAAVLTAATPHVLNHHDFIAASRTSSAPGFNVFRELGIHRREVKTHSAMLRFLLDPLARHGQGNLFLKAFLQAVARKPGWPDCRTPAPDASWTAKCEYPIGPSGRIDLLLESRAEGTSIVLENKIDAKDQDAQIARYARWQAELPPRVFPTRVLIYLTLRGGEPSPLSLGGHARPKSLILMGYQRDIAEILRVCLPEVQSEDIRILVSQYLSLIESL